MIEVLKGILILYHTIPTLKGPKEEGFGKQCWKRRKILVFLPVFSTLSRREIVNIPTFNVFGMCIQLSHVQNFVVWQRVEIKYLFSEKLILATLIQNAPKNVVEKEENAGKIALPCVLWVLVTVLFVYLNRILHCFSKITDSSLSLLQRLIIFLDNLDRQY